jgi:hypothetical protein
VTVILNITSVTSEPSSYAGGQTVTVNGTGLSENLDIYLCGFLCTITSATGNSATLLTPALLTAYSQTTFNINNDPDIVTNFTVIASLTNNMANAFDGNPSNSWRDTSHTYAWIGVNAGNGRYIQLSSITFIGGGTNNNYYKNLMGTLVQGSNDEITWDTLNNFTVVTDYTNTWVVPVNNEVTDNYPVYTYQYYRLYKEYAGNNYYLNEITI